MRPAERQRDGLARRFGGKLLIGGVAVALRDAAIAGRKIEKGSR
jgi:hypothetical protein